MGSATSNVDAAGSAAGALGGDAARLTRGAEQASGTEAVATGSDSATRPILAKTNQK